MAKVCANFNGLSKAMVRDGTLESPEKFKEFTLGFTQGKAHFDFIDVGHGKERADSKIKGSLCSLITIHGQFTATSHDTNFYKNVLDGI